MVRRLTRGGFSASRRQLFSSVGDLPSSELFGRGTSSRLLVWWKKIPELVEAFDTGTPTEALVAAVGTANRGWLLGVVSIWLLLSAVQFIFGVAFGQDITSQSENFQ